MDLSSSFSHRGQTMRHTHGCHGATNTVYGRSEVRQRERGLYGWLFLMNLVGISKNRNNCVKIQTCRNDMTPKIERLHGETERDPYVSVGHLFTGPWICNQLEVDLCLGIEKVFSAHSFIVIHIFSCDIAQWPIFLRHIRILIVMIWRKNNNITYVYSLLRMQRQNQAYPLHYPKCLHIITATRLSSVSDTFHSKPLCFKSIVHIFSCHNFRQHFYS